MSSIFNIWRWVTGETKAAVHNDEQVTEPDRSRVNLNHLAAELTRAEGLKNKQSVGQVKEFLGILGHRWRHKTDEEVEAEVACIRERAGLMSEHRNRK